MIARRTFLTSLIAAPAVVAASSLMPVRARPLTDCIEAANQSGSTIVVWPAQRPYRVGDIITIESVEAVNRITKRPTGTLRDFVVTRHVGIGDRVICLYPPIIPKPDRYQTVTRLPPPRARVLLRVPA